MKDKISCICITHQRVSYLEKAIAYFEKQTYPNKELLVIYEHKDRATKKYIEKQTHFHHLRLAEKGNLSGKQNKVEKLRWEKQKLRRGNTNVYFVEINSANPLSLGTKRNLATKIAEGEYICIWDDDDIYSKTRLHNQKNFIDFTKKPACTLANLIIYEESSGRKYLSSQRKEGWEGSLLCKRSEMQTYSDLNKQEDTPVLASLMKKNKLSVMEDPELYIYCLHKSNTSGNSHFEKLLSTSEILNSI